jgi:Domain of unknown function (DUF4282)
MSEGGFFSFRTFVSNTIIKTVYVLGAIIITLAGFLLVVTGIMMLSQNVEGSRLLPGGGIPSIAAGVTIMIGGNLLWRLMCEGWIILFSMHEMIAAIERKIVSGDVVDYSELIFKQLKAIDENNEQRHHELLGALRETGHAPRQVERLP